MDRLIQVVRPLDLIFTWGRSSKTENLGTLIVQEAIEGITGGPSHVRLYLNGEFFWEFTMPCCRFGQLDEIDLDRVDVEVGYHVGMERATLDQKLEILDEAKRLIGTPYDTWELFDHLMQEVGLDSEQDSDPRRFVCSTGVEHLFRTAGIPFRPDEPEQLVSPQDIRESRFYRVRWRHGDAPKKG